MNRLFKRFIISIALQLLFSSLVFGQKYQNGTRLLKGAEVLSATPLQLDYVLETLSDTAKIGVNIHEGKTHLILDDGSGQWREWWYYMGLWQPKTMGGASPGGKEGSIQLKSGDGFAGSQLTINEGFIKNMDETTGDVGLNNGNTTIRATSNGQVFMEATRNSAEGNITSHVSVSANDTEQNITWISKNKRGAGLRMDTVNLAHHSLMPDYWNFRSSLLDTTFYVKKRIRFDQPKTSIYIKEGDLRFSDKSGDYALSDLAGGSSGTGSVCSVGLSMPAIFTVTGSPVTSSGTLATTLKSQTKNTVLAAPVSANGIPAFRTLQESDIPGLHWNKITNTPTTISDYAITDAYTKSETNELMKIPGVGNRLLISRNQKAVESPVIFSHDNFQNPQSAILSVANAKLALVSNSMTGDQAEFSLDKGYIMANTSKYSESSGFSSEASGIRLHAKNAESTNFLNIHPQSITLTTNGSPGDFFLRKNHANGYMQLSATNEADVGTYNGIGFENLNTAGKGIRSYFRQKSGYNFTWTSDLYYSSFMLTTSAVIMASRISLTAAPISAGSGKSGIFINEHDFKYCGQEGVNPPSDGHVLVQYKNKERTLEVVQKIQLLDKPGVATQVGGISVTDDLADIRFNNKQKSITLTEVIQKGQFYTQASEPAIADNSFAFWISGSDFYLILRSKGIQKKLKMEN